MAGDSAEEKPPTAKKPNDPGGLSLAFALTILAGAVDAVSYLHWHGLFVSFMSGNSTALSVHTVQAETGKALLAAAVIGGFVVGVTVGELLASAVGRRVAEVVLILEAVLLATGAALLHANVDEFLVAPMLSCTMGIHNAAVHRGGGISVSLTYVTGTLVHMGRSVAKAIQGQSPGRLHSLICCSGLASSWERRSARSSRANRRRLLWRLPPGWLPSWPCSSARALASRNRPRILEPLLHQLAGM